MLFRSHELGGLLATRNISWAENPVSDERLGQLVALVITDKITGQTAKTLLPRLLTSPDMPEDIVQRENLGVSDSADDEVRAVLAVEFESTAGQPVVRALREMGDLETPKNAKKAKSLRGFFVGRVMRSMGGKVRPDRIEAVLDSMLSSKM